MSETFDSIASNGLPPANSGQLSPDQRSHETPPILSGTSELGAVSVWAAQQEDSQRHPEAVYSFVPRIAGLSRNERTRKQAQHPLYQGIIPSKDIPAAEQEPEAPIRITIKGADLIECNGQLLELQKDGLFIFNAMLLLKNRPMTRGDIFKLGYKPDTTEAARYHAFTRNGLPVIESLNEMAGEEIISTTTIRDKKVTKTLYAFSPRVTVDDERPDKGEALATEEPACLSATETETAKQFLAAMHRLVGKQVLSIASSRYPSEAHDIAQTVWLSFYEALTSGKAVFANAEGAAKWLSYVANNKAIDHVRATAGSAGEKVPYLIEDVKTFDTEGRDIYGQWQPSVESQALAAQALPEILNVLPEVYRQVVWEALVEGRSYADIAERNNKSVGNVRVILTRARKLLRDSLSAKPDA